MVSYAPFAGERAFETSADLFRIIDAIKWSGPPHGFAEKLPMWTSETSRDDNSSHLQRWELLHVLMQNLLIHWDMTRMGKIHVV